jgi:hypothetical protein
MGGTFSSHGEDGNCMQIVSRGDNTYERKA